jgi:hypothetical protein
MRTGSPLIARSVSRSRVFQISALLASSLAVGVGCSAGSGESSGGQALGLGDDAGGDAPMCRLGAQCAPGAPCPDLTIDGQRLQTSAHIDTRAFAQSDCAIFEGCVAAPGNRTLLRFDTATPNIGTGDLVLGAPQTDTACFVYSSCHNHYHFQNYAQYVLYATDGTTVVATGHKQAFCLEDVGPAPGVNAPAPSSYFTCSNQGIHRGYQDIYGSGLDCQWIDVTGVPPGNYILSVTVNFAHVVAELDYSNNEVRVPVTIPGGATDAGAATDAAADATPPEAGAPDAGPSDPCQAFGGCASCTAQAACGWCNDGQVGCHTGTGQGPNGGVCQPVNWAWTSNQCAAPPPPPPPDAGPDANDAAPANDAATGTTDPCASLAACGSCTAAATCGWCSDAQTCFTGTAGGPNGGQCARANWAWTSNQCTVAPSPPADAGTTPPNDACNAFTDCATCTQQPVCGFCDGTCSTGTATGPNGGSCSQTPWAWISSACR